ncbi:MAG: methyl-accepting chemotaxis protein [Spirochaetes bacterium]|nr:methyl-accepting chemotaxis protein [Spirochaetota bacterium]
MSEPIFFFVLGAAFAGAVMSFALRSYKKKIGALKAQAAAAAKEVAAFREKSVLLAAAVTESANALSFRVGGAGDLDKTGNIEKVEGTVNENARIAAEIAKKTNSVAVIASKMEEDVLSGFEVLEKNVKKMADIKEKNSSVINGIISLSNKVNKIRDIVRVINTITDQTKVIAFNAALEAASVAAAGGAGGGDSETGKRFSVVAAEVNRLADNIAGLTRQIREQIEEILSSSSFLIVYSEEGSDRIAEGYRLIKDLEDIFMEIRCGAEITSNEAQTITVSTQQQLKTSEQIHAGISEISRKVKQLAGASESAAANAQVLTERSGELERFLVVPPQQFMEDRHGD